MPKTKFFTFISSFVHHYIDSMLTDCFCITCTVFFFFHDLDFKMLFLCIFVSVSVLHVLFSCSFMI